MLRPLETKVALCHRNKLPNPRSISIYIIFVSSISSIIFPLFLSPPPSLDITQIWGHLAGSFLPSPNYGTHHHFYRENNSALASLVDSRRIVLTAHAIKRSIYSPLSQVMPTYHTADTVPSKVMLGGAHLWGLYLLGSRLQSCEWLSCFHDTPCQQTILYFRSAFFLGEVRGRWC